MSLKKGNFAAYSSIFLIVLFVGISIFSPSPAIECGGESDRECYVPLWQSLSIDLIIALYVVSMAVALCEGLRGKLNKFSSASLIISFIFLLVIVVEGGVWLSMESGH